MSADRKLRELNLDRTAISDRCLSAFADHRLRSLSIWDTDVTPDMAAKYQAEHPELESFCHRRSPTERHRTAIKRLTRLWAMMSDPPTDLEENVVLDVAWQGTPQDLGLLADLESRLRVVLTERFCTRDYVQLSFSGDNQYRAELPSLPGDDR